MVYMLQITAEARGYPVSMFGLAAAMYTACRAEWQTECRLVFMVPEARTLWRTEAYLNHKQPVSGFLRGRKYVSLRSGSTCADVEEAEQAMARQQMILSEADGIDLESAGSQMAGYMSYDDAYQLLK